MGVYVEGCGMIADNQSNAARKDDSGKPTFDLLPMESLAEIQRVLDFGAQKYDPWNWHRGMGWLRLWNACLRHLFAWVRGEDADPESGLPHLAHAGCCILFLLAYSRDSIGVDDRRKRLTADMASTTGTTSTHNPSQCGSPRPPICKL